MKFEDSDNVPMILKKQPIPEEYYTTIYCDGCELLLSRLFNGSEGCEIYENFFSLCEKCWEKKK